MEAHVVFNLYVHLVGLESATVDEFCVSDEAVIQNLGRISGINPVKNVHFKRYVCNP